MDIMKRINQIMIVLTQRDKLYKLNSYKFYLEDAQKYITKYIVSKKKLVIDEVTLAYKEKYIEELETFSKTELLNYFIKEYGG